MHPAELGAVAARAAIERAGIDPGRDRSRGHRARASGGVGPESRATGRSPRRPCRSRARADDQQGVRVGHAGGRRRRAGDPARRSRRRARRRHRVDEPHAVPASTPTTRGGATRWGNFALVDAMYRDGFTVLALADDHGGDRGGARARVRHHARGIRRVRARQPAPGRRARSREGRFAAEIAPVTCPDAKGGTTIVDADEHPRAGTTIEALKKLPPVFPQVDGQPGIITAGTSSGITDGGAAVLVASERRRARARPASPRADPRLGDRRRRSAHAWASGRCRRCASCSTALPAARSTTSISSSSTKRSPPQVLAVLARPPDRS